MAKKKKSNLKINGEDYKVEQARGFIDRHLENAKKSIPKFGVDLVAFDKAAKEGLIKGKKLVEKSGEILASVDNKFTNMAKKVSPDLIVEVSDNGPNFYKRSDSSMVSPEIQLETAEDDRVIGVPHVMTHAGDKVYIINGRVMTGWSMYFSLTAIRSPEDYSKNVDLVYNVPYLYASLNLKAQLGLGARFDVNYPDEEQEIPEEKFIEKLLFDKLKIDGRVLKKTDFHLSLYGNCYWHLRRGEDGITDKITILQPERMKIFLDPMTTKILFYIYLPPIIGGTVLTPYPETRENPNLVHNMALTYPLPIVIAPKDIIHFKQNDYTEYPFGFSDIKSCIDPAQARFDINLLAPIIFKKYAKPMIHWQMKKEGLSGKAIEDKLNEHMNMLEDMEPGSDPITTDIWTANPLNAPQGKNDLLNLTIDLDTQIFAVTAVPETYFKPKGSTDRMISEQDKTFLGRLKDRQEYVGGMIEDRIINPAIDIEFDKKKKEVDGILNTEPTPDETINDFLKEKGSHMVEELRYPKVEWKEAFKQDETQTIANTISLLQAGIINEDRAAKRVNEKPQEEDEDEKKESEEQVQESNEAMGEGEEDIFSLMKGGLDVNKNFRGNTGAESMAKGQALSKSTGPSGMPKAPKAPAFADNGPLILKDGDTTIVIKED